MRPVIYSGVTLLCMCLISQTFALNTAQLGLRSRTTNGFGDELDLSQLVHQFLKKIEAVLSGNDPYNLGSLSSSFNSYGTVFNGSGNNLIMSGMGTIQMKNVTLIPNEPNLDLVANLSFGSLMMVGDYFLDVDMLTMLKFYGSGQFGLKLSQVNLNISCTVTQDNKILKLSNLSVNLDASQFHVDVKNILNRPAMGVLVSKILNDVIPTALKHDEQLMKLLSSLINSSINSYTVKHNVTLDYIIDFMQKFIQ